MTDPILAKLKANLRRMEERGKAVIKMRDSGMSLRQVGKELGVSSTRASELEARARHMASRGDPFSKLSRRTQNCLEAEGISTIAELRKAMESGRLDKSVPNLGAVSLAELREFLEGVVNGKRSVEAP